MEKVAQAGAVTLKHAGRSMLVEPRDGSPVVIEEPGAATDRAIEGTVIRPPETRSEPREYEDEEGMPSSPMTMQDGIRAVQKAFGETVTPPRWPLYVRQAKQLLRGAVDGFDERHYGFASVVDLLRAAGKEGVVRVDRDRHGAIRIFPGAKLVDGPATPPVGDDPGVPLQPDQIEVPPVEQAAAEPVESPAPVEEPKRTTRRTRARAVKSSKPRARKIAQTKEAAASTGE
jgi:hypothetical protein